MRQPEVSVCIVESIGLSFVLNGLFQAKGCDVTGLQTAEYSDGGVKWNGAVYQEIVFKPTTPACTIEVKDVRIGIDFHWERTETQVFKGMLKFIVNDGKLCAINLLPVEEYLVSVISSEMSANASLQFLKAHAVISRGWLLAQIDKRKRLSKTKQNNTFFSFRKNDDMMVRWYDREDHTLFDVCADDHCQRYQGITKASTPAATQAVNETKGQVLTWNGKICDTRFSKCCGGAMERFSTCWEDEYKPYLQGKLDYMGKDAERLPDLSQEQNARGWIDASPIAFCNTTDRLVLIQILNDYDQETANFYRWTVEYTQAEIRELIEKKTKQTLGAIVDLIPLKRGTSGRIELLKIVGTEKSYTVGKELLIRKVLSETHLLSSAFYVDKVIGPTTDSSIPERFVIKGAGWGHGVGLCQIGAAVMGSKGFDYQQILSHYYPNATITTMY